MAKKIQVRKDVDGNLVVMSIDDQRLPGTLGGDKRFPRLEDVKRFLAERGFTKPSNDLDDLQTGRNNGQAIYIAYEQKSDFDDLYSAIDRYETEAQQVEQDATPPPLPEIVRPSAPGSPSNRNAAQKDTRRGDEQAKPSSSSTGDDAPLVRF